MEIEVKSTEQLRKCSGISGELVCWSHLTVKMAATLAATLACRAGMPKVDVSDAFVSVSSE
jgi:hypothetical protein